MRQCSGLTGRTLIRPCSVLAALWMTMDGSPGHLVAGFAVIAAMTLPIYSILAAHSNDQLSAGQIVAASGTMAFLMQLGQLAASLLGRTWYLCRPVLVAVIGTVVVVMAVTRRLRTEARTSPRSSCRLA